MPRPLALVVAVSVAGLALAWCGPRVTGDAGSESLTVLAASSLAAVMPELSEAFAAREPGIAVRPRYGGSTALALQLLDGAPADVLITADRASMDEAAAAVDRAEVVARNQLAIAVPPDNPAGVSGVADLGRAGRRVVVCAPQVPCGRLAAALLDRVGVRLRPVSLEQDVRAVAAKVSLGEADAGIVYATDAHAGGRGIDVVKIAEASDPDLQAVYVAAAVRDSERRERARAFVAFLRSSEAQQILTSHGFARP